MRMPDHTPPTPERMKKGGLRAYHDAHGHYMGCTREPDTVLGVLIDRGVIEASMQDVADTLHEWKRAFLSPVRSHSGAAENSKEHGGMFVDADRYRFLWKAMKRCALELCENASTPAWEPDAAHPAATYRLAFDTLTDAMRKAFKEVTREKVMQQLAAVDAK